MKKLVYLILFLFFSIHVYPADKVHIVSLEKQNISIPNLGFRLVGVTNATGENKSIGFVEKTIAYKAVPAFFKNDIAEEVMLFLRRNFKDATGSTDLIVRVNTLEISETYNGVNETATAKVSLSFIYTANDSYFEKLTVSTQVKKISAAGVTKSQPKIIAQAIADCFTTFNERVLGKKLTDIEIKEEDLTKKPIGEQNLIDTYLAADRSVKGIYKTFFDFKANTPDVDTKFNVDYKLKSNADESVNIKYARLTDGRTGEKISNVWGFTDGKLVYTLVGRKYLPLVKDEKSFYLELKVQDQATMTYAGLAGGLIGSAIAYAAAPVIKVRLDYFTGEFDYSGQSVESFKARHSNEGTIRFFSSAFNSKNSRLELYVNDELQCTLKKDSWYKYNVPADVKSIKISLKSTNGMHTTLALPVNTYIEDIYVCMDKKKKEPVMDKVQANRVAAFENLMAPENRIYGKVAGKVLPE